MARVPRHSHVVNCSLGGYAGVLRSLKAVLQQISDRFAERGRGGHGGRKERNKIPRKDEMIVQRPLRLQLVRGTVFSHSPFNNSASDALAVRSGHFFLPLHFIS